MKFIFLIIPFLISTICKSQENSVYSSFDIDLTKTLWKIEMQDDSSVRISADFGKIETYTRALFPAQRANFFYLDVSGVIPDRKEKGFAIVEIDNKLLTLYHENIFSGKQEAEKILNKTDTLEYFSAIYMVKDISLLTAQKFPDVTKISVGKLAELRKLNQARQEKVRKIPTDLEFKRKMRIFAKQHFWLNAHLLLLGYMPSETPEQNKFIVEKLQ